MKVTFRFGSKRRSNNEKRLTEWLPAHFYELELHRSIDLIYYAPMLLTLYRMEQSNNPIRTFVADYHRTSCHQQHWCVCCCYWLFQLHLFGKENFSFRIGAENWMAGIHIMCDMSFVPCTNDVCCTKVVRKN